MQKPITVTILNAYQRCRSTDVDQFLHPILEARLKHVRVDCHETLTLFMSKQRKYAAPNE